jgi:hypothetical protein
MFTETMAKQVLKNENKLYLLITKYVVYEGEFLVPVLKPAL